MKEATIGEVLREISSVKILAEYLGVSTCWVYQHMHQIPHLKVSGLYFFERNSIHRWLTTFEGSPKEKKINTKEEAERIAREILAA